MGLAHNPESRTIDGGNDRFNGWEIEVCTICNDWRSSDGHSWYTAQCPGKRIYEGLANRTIPAGAFPIKRLY